MTGPEISRNGLDADHPAIGYSNIGYGIQARGWINHPPTLDQDAHDVFKPVSDNTTSGLIASHDAHHRHAHRDAKSHLRQDHTLRAIDHRRINFYAPIDRARVHHDGIWAGKL